MGWACPYLKHTQKKTTSKPEPHKNMSKLLQNHQA